MCIYSRGPAVIIPMQDKHLESSLEVLSSQLPRVAIVSLSLAFMPRSLHVELTGARCVGE